MHPYLYGIVIDILPLPIEKSKNIWQNCKIIREGIWESGGTVLAKPPKICYDFEITYGAAGKGRAYHGKDYKFYH